MEVYPLFDGLHNGVKGMALGYGYQGLARDLLRADGGYCGDKISVVFKGE